MARKFLEDMGYSTRFNARNAPLDLSNEEIDRYKEIFETFDTDKSGTRCKLSWLLFTNGKS